MSDSPIIDRVREKRSEVEKAWELAGGLSASPKKDWNDWKDFDRVNWVKFDEEDGHITGIEVGDPKGPSDDK